MKNNTQWNILKVITISFLISAVAIIFLVYQDVKQISETKEFIYENQVHKDFCELAESRDAPLDYLITNKCK